MLDFFVRKIFVHEAQGHVRRLAPPVTIHIPPDLPLPSVMTIRRAARMIAQINGLEPQISALTDDQLKAKTAEFKARYQEGVGERRGEWEALKQELRKAPAEERDDLVLRVEKAREDYKKVRQTVLNGLLPEAFAVVRETGKRRLGLRHFDIQLAGGMVLHEGKIAEMPTGEGKTLVATLPAYLNALTGEGVHVVTVNDYLARRDREWMGPLYEFLGLSVGVILHDLDPRERRKSYACDITYGTNNEFGFDYLRDNMVISAEEMVQRPHHFAIVDEVDSILIDEARTPLIISGPAEESTDTYYKANEVVKHLKGRRITEQEEIDAKYRNEDLSKGYDYVADEKARSIALSDQGEEKAARMLGIANLHDMDTIEFRHHVLQALKAKEFFKRDVDYVVRDGEVIIVDDFTGRLMPGRRWSDGLHQAVEAKEGIRIERENQTLATITFQNYFRMYDKLSGMTGTAHTEANEFKQIYNLDCVVMPTNRPLRRANHSDCIYKSVREKFEAVVAEVEEYHRRGQPVLVGTISIEKSEILSAMLKRKGITHEVLNAKYHEREAQIVAQAGRHKAVTIATNMAGRGTDILLGGNSEFLARALAQEQSGAEAAPEEQEALIQTFLAQFRDQVKKEHDQVVEAGGLHVIGTERHESRRIDNQLRGRSGRQGDPGSSRFFISLEDDLMRLFASDRIMAIMDKWGMEEGQVIEHPLVTKAISVAQKRVESHNFEIRKQLLEYDNVMNKQREAIYGLRRTVLESDDVKDLIIEAVEDVIEAAVDQHLFLNKEADARDYDGLALEFKGKFGFDPTPLRADLEPMDREQVTAELTEQILKGYAAKEAQIGPQQLRRLERYLLLTTIDTKWKDHLYAMDQLKGGVGLRSYAQRDPLVEYKREGFEMFRLMYISINQDVAGMIFRIQPVESFARRSVFNSLPQKLVHEEVSSLSASTEAPVSSADGAPLEPPAPQPVEHSGPKVGRNDPCPCGSGKKYKKCCGQ